MKVPVPTFWKHVLTVLTGSLAAQALPILAAPLITRMCTPEDLGAFSVWLGLIAVSSIAATLRLETAMILDHGLAAQRTCFSVVAYSANILALVITLLAILAHMLGLPLTRHMSWLSLLSIGLGTWLTAYMQTTLAYATSANQFGKAAKAKVLGAATIAIAQVSLLYLGGGGVALQLGQLLGLLTGLITATYLLAPPRPRLCLRLTGTQLNYLKKHHAFWRFSLPANLLNSLVGQMPLFLIGLKHGVLAAGLFALTQRVLAAPISLLAASVLEVFKRQSVHDFQTIGNCKHSYQHTFKVLLLLGCGPSLLMFLFSPAIFAWVFGENWRAAGDLAHILAPLYFLNFIASPLSYVFFVAGKQKIELVWQITLFLMTVIAFTIPTTLKDSIVLYTTGYSLLYIAYLKMSYTYSKNKLSTI